MQKQKHFWNKSNINYYKLHYISKYKREKLIKTKINEKDITQFQSVIPV